MLSAEDGSASRTSERMGQKVRAMVSGGIMQGICSERSGSPPYAGDTVVLREVEKSTVVLLPSQPASVAVARRRITAEMRSIGVEDDAIDDAALVITELVTNAIKHGSPLPGRWLQVTWDMDTDSVEIAVSDAGGSGTRPRANRPSLSAMGGRGLEIVDTLSDRWGVRPPGTTVWAILAMPGAYSNGQLRQPGHAAG
jgi:anti-sigma regulatory factor (Ser/Thr protein kinase)